MKKKIINIILATIIGLSTNVNAFASTAADNMITDASGNVNSSSEGYTQLGIASIDSGHADALKNVVFEIPLYVSMAVVTGDNKVITPTNYYIRNLSLKKGVAGLPDIEYPISISKIDFSTFKTSSFTFVNGTPSAANQMRLTIGGITPTITGPDMTSTHNGNSSGPDSLLISGSVFADGNVLKQIPYNGVLNIPIEAEVKGDAYSTASGLSEQLKVNYTVDPIVTVNGGSGTIGNVVISDTKPW